MFLFNSTFTTGSGFSVPSYPVSVSFVTPSSVTITFDTYFNSDKSKYFSCMYSLSISSSSGLSLSGTESLSGVSFPSSSVSSVISAVFIIGLFPSVTTFLLL